MRSKSTGRGRAYRCPSRGGDTLGAGKPGLPGCPLFFPGNKNRRRRADPTPETDPGCGRLGRRKQQRSDGFDGAQGALRGANRGQPPEGLGAGIGADIPFFYFQKAGLGRRKRRKNSRPRSFRLVFGFCCWFLLSGSPPPGPTPPMTGWG